MKSDTTFVYCLIWVKKQRQIFKRASLLDPSLNLVSRYVHII